MGSFAPPYSALAMIHRGIVLAILLCPSMVEAITCAQTFQKLGDLKARKYSMESGDEIKFADGSSAFFLGTHKRKFVFLNKSNGSIFSSPVSESLGLNEISSRPLSLRVMSDPVGDSCAVISTIACLRVLDEMEGLEHAVLRKIMNPGIFGRIARFEAQLFDHISNAGVHSYVGGDSAVQIKARADFFKAHGIRNKVHASIGELRTHLQQGYPAILDVMVNYTREGILAPSVTQEAVLGGHSVAAVRWFTLSNGEERVMVYDSSSKQFLIWSIASLQKAVEANLLTEFTLVYPSWVK